MMTRPRTPTPRQPHYSPSSLRGHGVCGVGKGLGREEERGGPGTAVGTRPPPPVPSDAAVGWDSTLCPAVCSPLTLVPQDLNTHRSTNSTRPGPSSSAPDRPSTSLGARPPSPLPSRLNTSSVDARTHARSPQQIVDGAVCSQWTVGPGFHERAQATSTKKTIFWDLFLVQNFALRAPFALLRAILHARHTSQAHVPEPTTSTTRRRQARAPANKRDGCSPPRSPAPAERLPGAPLPSRRARWPPSSPPSPLYRRRPRRLPSRASFASQPAGSPSPPRAPPPPLPPQPAAVTWRTLTSSTC
jgi:hypothetical protein